MKKILPVLFCLMFLPLLFACVKESPEPIFDPSSIATEDRKVILTDEIKGVTYQVYNDNTCEIVAFESENADANVLDLPSEIDGAPVTVIHDGVFEGAAFHTVKLPEKLRVLGKKAFQKSSIESIVLPDSLTEMGEECFDNCLSLEKVTFGKKLKTIPTGAFYGCKSLKEIKLPKGVEIIGEEAFGALSALEKVTLPETLCEIGPYAFWNSGTAALTFSIPKSTAKIGKNAFLETHWQSTKMDEFVLVGDGVLLLYNGKSTSVTLPKEVKYLSNAFDRSPVLDLTLNESIKGIDEDALKGSKIKKVTYAGKEKDIFSAIESYQ